MLLYLVRSGVLDLNVIDLAGFYESEAGALLLSDLPSRSGIRFYEFLQDNKRSLLVKL